MRDVLSNINKNISNEEFEELFEYFYSNRKYNIFIFDQVLERSKENREQKRKKY